MWHISQRWGTGNGLAHQVAYQVIASLIKMAPTSVAIKTLLEYGKKDPITDIGVKVPLPKEEYHRIVRDHAFQREFRALSPYDKKKVIIGMFLWEESDKGWGLGSTSQLHQFLAMFEKDVTRVKTSKAGNAKQLQRIYENTVTKLLAMRKNPYIPFGHSVPEEIRSYHDYELWCNLRNIKQEEKSHSDRMTALTKQKERLIRNTEKTKRNLLRSIERDEINAKMIEYDEGRKINLMVQEITNGPYPINFYPEWVADRIAKSPEILKNERNEQFEQKLSHAKRGTKWRNLIRVFEKSGHSDQTRDPRRM